jgi:hypothetical protein
MGLINKCLITISTIFDNPFIDGITHYESFSTIETLATFTFFFGTLASGVPRMLLHDLDQEMQVEEHGQNGYAHFCRYYRDVQLLLGLEDWERCEKLFFSPVPLSLRINRTSMHQQTLQTLQETFGTRAEMVSLRHTNMFSSSMPTDVMVIPKRVSFSKCSMYGICTNIYIHLPLK